MNETKINELTDQISKAKAILNDLTEQLEAEKNKIEEKKEPSIEDRWEPKFDEMFFRIESSEVEPTVWTSTIEDKFCFDSYNTWKTETRAEEILNKTKLLWLMEQIHDILCPNYIPDWENNEERKYAVYFDFDDNKWLYGWNCGVYRAFTYFDTEEHIEQACKILNDMGVKSI